MDGRRCAPKGNAHRGAGASSGSSSKRKAAGAEGRGAGKKPIKVVYIGNPMRVTTSAEGFRALVQELTGRHADPSKYSGGGAIVDVDDDSSGGSSSLQAEPQQPGALAPISSPGGSTEGSSGAVSAAAGQVQPAAQQAPGFDATDDDESFMPQLIDNSYAMFSPPTFLYGYHGDLM